MSHDDIGARVDRCMGDFSLILQHVFAVSPMVRRNHDVRRFFQVTNVLTELREILGIRPCDNFCRGPRPVRRNLVVLVIRRLVSGIRFECRDACRVGERFVVVRPGPRGSLHEAVAHAIAFDDDGRSCRQSVDSRPCMRNAKAIELCIRSENCLCAVVLIVRVSQRVKARKR